MDNAESTSGAAPSQGQAQPQTPPAPSDAQGNQTSAAVGAEQAQSPAKGQTEGSEGLILGKFKTTDEVVRAYQELESHNKKVEMDKAELEKLFVPTEPPQPQTAAEPEKSDDPLKEVADALAPRLTSEMNRMLSPVLAKMEIESMVRKHGDEFIALAPQVAELRKQNPSLSLESAFKIVGYDNVKRTAHQEGATQAAVAAEQSQKAQVESSISSGYKAPTAEEALQAAKSNKELAEVFDAMGPEYHMWKEISKRRAGK